MFQGWLWHWTTNHSALPWGGPAPSLLQLPVVLCGGVRPPGLSPSSLACLLVSPLFRTLLGSHWWDFLRMYPCGWIQSSEQFNFHSAEDKPTPQPSIIPKLANDCDFFFEFGKYLLFFSVGDTVLLWSPGGLEVTMQTSLPPLSECWNQWCAPLCLAVLILLFKWEGEQVPGLEKHFTEWGNGVTNHAKGHVFVSEFILGVPVALQGAQAMPFSIDRLTPFPDLFILVAEYWAQGLTLYAEL